MSNIQPRKLIHPGHRSPVGILEVHAVSSTLLHAPGTADQPELHDRKQHEDGSVRLHGAAFRWQHGTLASWQCHAACMQQCGTKSVLQHGAMFRPHGAWGTYQQEAKDVQWHGSVAQSRGCAAVGVHSGSSEGPGDCHL